jgi:hypothetical protein
MVLEEHLLRDAAGGGGNGRAKVAKARRKAGRKK